MVVNMASFLDQKAWNITYKKFVVENHDVISNKLEVISQNLIVES